MYTCCSCKSKSIIKCIKCGCYVESICGCIEKEKYKIVYLDNIKLYICDECVIEIKNIYE